MSAEALFDQAKRAHAAGQPADAERLYRQVLTLQPAHAGAIHGMGGLAFDQGQNQVAAELLGIALEIEPGRVAALTLLGSALERLWRGEEALAAFDRAISLRSDHALAHYGRGWVLWRMGRADEALAGLELALALDPDLAQPFSQRLLNFLHEADWSGLDQFGAFVERTGAPLHPSVAMFYADSAAVAGRIARQFVARHYRARAPLWKGARYDHARCRVAYVGGDFGDHPVGRHLVGVLEAHDRSLFEVIGVSHGSADDHPIRARLSAACDHFLDVAGQGDEAIARMLCEREVDIVVSLSGYTEHGRPDVLAWRAAPVQVSYLGYPGTLGADYIDYLIADRHTVPPGDEAAYAEQIVRLPDVYHPTDDQDAAAGSPASRAAEGLPPDAVVLMAYGQTHKIRPPRFDTWMRILAAVPGAVLWLSDNGEASSVALRRHAAARGVDPDRLVFASRVRTRGDHLERYRLADLYLDSAPHNAHATACDALWMGLPVLTRPGHAFCGRVCAGLVAAAGFPQLVASSEEEYEAKAVALSRDRSALKDLRSEVERNARQSPLFATRRHARLLEAAFEVMLHRTRNGFEAKGFDVEPLAVRP